MWVLNGSRLFLENRRRVLVDHVHLSLFLLVDHVHLSLFLGGAHLLDDDLFFLGLLSRLLADLVDDLFVYLLVDLFLHFVGQLPVYLLVHGLVELFLFFFFADHVVEEDLLVVLMEFVAQLALQERVGHAVLHLARHVLDLLPHLVELVQVALHHVQHVHRLLDQGGEVVLGLLGGVQSLLFGRHQGSRRGVLLGLGRQVLGGGRRGVLLGLGRRRGLSLGREFTLLGHVALGHLPRSSLVLHLELFHLGGHRSGRSEGWLVLRLGVQLGLHLDHLLHRDLSAQQGLSQSRASGAFELHPDCVDLVPVGLGVTVLPREAEDLLLQGQTLFFG